MDILNVKKKLFKSNNNDSINFYSSDNNENNIYNKN